jgi:hypothetical protein
VTSSDRIGWWRPVVAGVLVTIAAARTFVVAVAALWYLSIDHPTGNTALWFVVGVVIILLLTELLAAPAADSPSDQLTVGEGSSP